MVVGYVAFAGGSMLLVGPVMAQTGPLAMVLGLAGLLLIGLVAGFLAAKISGDSCRIAGIVLTALIVLATLANLLMELGAEPRWYKLGTLLLTAPMILLVCLRPNR